MEPCPTPPNAELGSPFVRRVGFVIGWVCLAAMLLWLAWTAIHIWLAVFVGVLVALFLTTLTDWVECRTRIPHGWALALVVLVLLGVGAGTGWLLADPISKQLRGLVEELPRALSNFRVRLEHSSLGHWLPDSEVLVQQFSAGSTAWVSHLAGAFSNTFEAIALLLVVFFVGLYLAADPGLYARGLVALFPVRSRGTVRELLCEIGTTLRQWLLGQVVSMVAVGAMTSFGLWLIGIPVPLALGILAGLLDFIPLVGPILSATPAVLLGFLGGPWDALWVMLVFVIVNQVESHLLIPLIQRYVVALPPVLTLVALVVFGTIWGLLGLLLAAPITAVLVLVVRRVYVERFLEHRRA